MEASERTWEAELAFKSIKDVECYYCHKLGHKIISCPSREVKMLRQKQNDGEDKNNSQTRPRRGIVESTLKDKQRENE